MTTTVTGPAPTSPGSTDEDALAALAAAVGELSKDSSYRLADASVASAESPSPECDVVMKGGITSGVVYPLAVCQLATRQRLRSIGGSSAGAIAAAAAAAAEYRRASGSGAGFVRLAALPSWLGTNLSNLFQPAPSTSGLYGLVYALTGAGNKKLHLMLAVLRATRIRGLLGAVPGLIAGGAAIGLLADAIGHWDAAAIAATVLVGLLVVALVLIGLGAGIVWTLWADATKDLPGNYFGLCRGHRSAGEAATRFTKGPALTDWLSGELSAIAGVDRPLTFGDLWGPAAVAAAVELDQQARDGGTVGVGEIDAARALRSIDLLVTTTNLSHGLADHIPFSYTPGQSSPLLYCPTDLAMFFPDAVVAQVGSTSADTMIQCPQHPDQRLRFLPRPWDLPVVIAARMSLSFPALISAIRLYELSTDSPGTALEVWYSDGGICSNFPMHFFDSMLPARPTYGFDLVPYPLPEPGEPADDVTPIPPPGGGKVSRYDRLGTGLGPFVSAIADTAQNNRDTAQALMPGFRDRIAHIRHTASEGGMNLQMQPAAIARLALRGQLAAQDLQSWTTEPAQGFDWPQHRFTRYRMAMAGMQRTVSLMVQRIQVAPPAPPYGEFLATFTPRHDAWPPGMDAQVERATAAFESLGAGWDADARPFLADPPEPLPDLRWQPPV